MIVSYNYICVNVDNYGLIGIIMDMSGTGEFPPITRRRFLITTALLTAELGAFFAGFDIGLARRIFADRPQSKNRLDFVDPVSGIPSPLDLVEIDKSDLEQIRQAVDTMTQGNDGLVPLHALIEEASKAQTVFLGDGHWESGDKIMHRRIIAAHIQKNPQRSAIIALGIAMPDQNYALNKFVFGNRKLTDDQALKELFQETGLCFYSPADAYLCLEQENSPARQMALTLKMARQMEIMVRGIGVDVGREGENPYQKATNYERREQEGAELIATTEQENPDSTVFVITGRPHIVRSQRPPTGLPMKLERLRRNQLFADSRTVSINFLQILTEGRFVTDMIKIVGIERLRNAVLCVKNPKYSSAEWTNKNEGAQEFLFPGVDYYVASFYLPPAARFTGNP